jgi:hypothetical protein
MPHPCGSRGGSGSVEDGSQHEPLLSQEHQAGEEGDEGVSRKGRAGQVGICMGCRLHVNLIRAV